MSSSENAVAALLRSSRSRFPGVTLMKTNSRHNSRGFAGETGTLVKNMSSCISQSSSNAFFRLLLCFKWCIGGKNKSVSRTRNVLSSIRDVDVIQTRHIRGVLYITAAVFVIFAGHLRLGWTFYGYSQSTDTSSSARIKRRLLRQSQVVILVYLCS